MFNVHTIIFGLHIEFARLQYPSITSLHEPCCDTINLSGEGLLAKFFCRYSSRDPGRRYLCTDRMARPRYEFWHSLGTDRSHVEHICWKYHPEVELLSQAVSLPEGMHVLYTQVL